MGALAQAAQGRVIAPAQSQAVSFIDDHGDEITISSDDVRMHICPQADAKEVAYFMELCRAQRLNPFLNEAYLVKFKGAPAQIMVAHKALVKRAEAHPQYDGMEHGVVVMRDGTVHTENRGAYYPEAGEVLLGGWCKEYRKDRRFPVYAERSFTSMNKNQANWKSMPDVMIDKCAQAAALREAFPDELRGLYAQEEMGAQEVASTSEPVSAPPAAKTNIAAATNGFTEDDMDWFRTTTAQLVAAGYEEASTKKYLWDIARGHGMDAAKENAEKLFAQVEQPAEQQAQEPDEVTIAEEDIEFGPDVNAD